MATPSVEADAEAESAERTACSAPSKSAWIPSPVSLISRPRGGYMHNDVPAIGLTSFDQREPRWKDGPAHIEVVEAEDLDAAIRERGNLVRLRQGFALKACHRPSIVPPRNR